MFSSYLHLISFREAGKREIAFCQLLVTGWKDLALSSQSVAAVSFESSNKLQWRRLCLSIVHGVITAFG